MDLRGTLFVAIMLIALGGGLVVAAPDPSEPETDIAYQYHGFEVEYEDELEITRLYPDDEQESVNPTYHEVDDRILCLPGSRWECYAATNEFEDEDPIPPRRSRFDYVYIDGEFYRHSDFERVEASAAFDDLAVDAEFLSSAERTAIEDGRVVTTRTLDRADRLIRFEGGYYTIKLTGVAREIRTSQWDQTTDDFSQKADEVRDPKPYGSTWRQGLYYLGFVGIVSGVVVAAWSGWKRLSKRRDW